MKKNILLLTASLCICFFISQFILQVTLIQGDSMLPAYHNMEFALVWKQYQTLERGDVILFRCDAVNGTLIKRIVATPGDSVEIYEGILYINNAPSTEAISPLSYAGIAETPLHLGEDEYFVLGDNSEYSKDSRYPEIGCIRQASIIGKVYPQKRPVNPLSQ